MTSAAITVEVSAAPGGTDRVCLPDALDEWDWRSGLTNDASALLRLVWWLVVESAVRRSARAILIDDQGLLVLIKRTRSGSAPYWTAPGGGVEPDDPSVEAALVRELREELGAEVESPQQVFLVSSPAGVGISVQHFFVCRLRNLDLSQRSGPEFGDPARGRYDLDRVALTSDDLAQVDLKPDELRNFILANRVALLDAASID